MLLNSKYLYLFLFFFNNLYTNEFIIDLHYSAIEQYIHDETEYLKNPQTVSNQEFKRDVICISLGYNCMPAFLLIRLNLHEFPFPFNWQASSFDSIYNLFTNNFKDYLNINNLEEIPCKYPPSCDPNNPHRLVKDTKYGSLLVHDFPKSLTIIEGYKEVKDKYDRRIQRLYRAIKSGKKIYFVRLGINKNQSQTLAELLSKKFPRCKFTLVAIDTSEEIKVDWNIPNVQNFYINPDAVNWDNSKSLESLNVWREIFVKLQLLKI